VAATKAGARSFDTTSNSPRKSETLAKSPTKKFGRLAKLGRRRGRDWGLRIFFHPPGPWALSRADLIARYNFDEAWEGRCDAFARVSAHISTLIGAREGAAVIALRS